ncbi:macro domain-containing protein [Streptomyces sp. NBC_01716]|uniref:macro domain-containing protein n=1 Tax=Streptomyces sp. NBC_01716 TaxID=2975917 RepID=UPI002E34F633|nr:macro domain-containing protein [Streptomyces sp. NBC_01716]
MAEDSRARLIYAHGDATAPLGSGNRVIAHVCNDIGAWGRGFVMSLSRRGPEPEAAYRAWHQGRGQNDFRLGAVQLVRVAPELWVANMVGQRGIRRAGGNPPVRYEAIDEALGHLAEQARRLDASVHMPRIGCGLAGGEWARIEPLIRNQLCGRGVNVAVYDLAVGAAA